MIQLLCYLTSKLDVTLVPILCSVGLKHTHLERNAGVYCKDVTWCHIHLESVINFVHVDSTKLASIVFHNYYLSHILNPFYTDSTQQYSIALYHSYIKQYLHAML